MVSRRVRVVISILSGVLIAATFAISCTVPLPTPRETRPARVATTTPTVSVPTTAAPNTPPQAPTNTPVILVLPTHTPQPPDATATPTSEPPTETATQVVSYAIDTPTLKATKTATKTPPTSTATLVMVQPTTPESELSVETTRAPEASPTKISISLPTATQTVSTVSMDKATSSPTVALATATALPAATAKTAVTLAPQSETPIARPTYETGDVILNGSFEQGFGELGIGKDWQGFDHVAGVYGWSDETWPGLLWNGQHAQMMRIIFTSEPDQYIGIQQTVAVVKGETYELTFHGLIRSAEGSAEKSRWGYRIQWGIDQKGRDSWQVVQDWHDTGWDDQPLEATSYNTNEYKTTIVAEGDTLTLFIRGWRKWGTQDREVDFVIDGVSLVGPMPTGLPSNLPTTGAFLPALAWPNFIAGFGLAVVIFGLHQVRIQLSTEQ